MVSERTRYLSLLGYLIADLHFGIGAAAVSQRRMPSRIHGNELS